MAPEVADSSITRNFRARAQPGTKKWGSIFFICLSDMQASTSSAPAPEENSPVSTVEREPEGFVVVVCRGVLYYGGGTTRRFIRKVKRSYKDVKRAPLGSSFYIHGSIEHHHEVHGDAPVFNNLNKDGATGWALILQPWNEFTFNKGVIEPSHVGYIGPIRSNKIHQRGGPLG